MPFSSTAITKPPSTASTTRPLPPKRLVPPMTAAPTANSRVSEPPVDGDTELVRLDQEDAGDRRHASST